MEGGKGREGKGREGKGNGWGAIQFLASGRHRLSYATDLGRIYVRVIGR